MLDMHLTPEGSWNAWVYLTSTGRKAWVPMTHVRARRCDNSTVVVPRPAKSADAPWEQSALREAGGAE